MMKPIPLDKLMKEFRYPDKWGDWHFNKQNLCLNLLPTNHKTQWNNNCPFYQIDLEKINTNSELLFWIFHINGKNIDCYGENVVKDLVAAFSDIFYLVGRLKRGDSREFSGSAIAKKYKLELNLQNKKK